MSALDVVEIKDIFLAGSSRTDLYDDVVDVTSFSALDVVKINEIKTCFLLSSSLSALDVVEIIETSRTMHDCPELGMVQGQGESV